MISPTESLADHAQPPPRLPPWPLRPQVGLRHLKARKDTHLPLTQPYCWMKMTSISGFVWAFPAGPVHWQWPRYLSSFPWRSRERFST